MIFCYSLLGTSGKVEGPFRLAGRCLKGCGRGTCAAFQDCDVRGCGPGLSQVAAAVLGLELPTPDEGFGKKGGNAFEFI